MCRSEKWHLTAIAFKRLQQQSGRLKKKSGLFRAIVFVVLLGLPAFLLCAAGLTLYSYRDDSGTIIVVDSIEKIPEQYLDQVETGYIPSFSSPEKPADKNLKKENNPDELSHQEKLIKPIDLDLAGEIKVQAPPDEVELPDPAVASITQIMKNLREVQLNYERLHVQALARGLGHPVIRHFHLSNVLLLKNILPPGEIELENSDAWKRMAGEVIEQMRSLQYTVSRWLDGSSRGIVEAMPPLLARMKMQISLLEKEYKKILADEAARLQKAD